MHLGTDSTVYGSLKCNLWTCLPSALVQHLVSLIAGASCGRAYAEAKALLRLSCTDWWRALPMGHTLPVHLWEWDDAMRHCLAPFAQDIVVLSPQAWTTPPSTTPLAHLHSCVRLRSLKLCHAAPAVLDDAVAALESLTKLHVTVCWASSAKQGWLDFCGHLTHLQDLSVEASSIRLQPQGGLTTLQLLAPHLRRLRLADCVLTDDHCAPCLAGLSRLSALDLSPSSLGQFGVHLLADSLTQLQELSIRLQDGVDGSRLTQLPGLTRLDLQMSRLKANDFVGAAGRMVPQAKRLRVELSGGPPHFHLTAPFQGGDRLRQLEALHLPGVQVADDVAAHLAQCTALEELSVDLDWTVRGSTLQGWSALRMLRMLSLRCTSHLGDAELEAMLAKLPALEDLSFDSLQGSGAPLRALRHALALTRLRLTACRFDSGTLLGDGLAGVLQAGKQEPAAPEQQGPRLAVLEIEACSPQTAVLEAVTGALGGVPPPPLPATVPLSPAEGHPWHPPAAISASAHAQVQATPAAAVTAPWGGGVASQPASPADVCPVGRQSTGMVPSTEHLPIPAAAAGNAPRGQLPVEVAPPGTTADGAGALEQGPPPAVPPPALRALRIELKWRVAGDSSVALAAAIAACSQLTTLDVHFPPLSDPVAASSAWAALSSLTSLRMLHVSSGMGWGAASLRSVCHSTPLLRHLTITDNQGTVGDEWLQALAPLSRLSHLELNSCRGLTAAGAVPALAALTALTGLESYRCPGITSVKVMERLREALPCLARVSLRE